MAPPFTWRNVDAPDFRGSLDGLRLAGVAMDRAFSGLSEGLGRFQDWRKDQAGAAVLNNAQAFRDPASLREAIADGSIFSGINRALISRETLAALNNQAGTLINQAAGQQSLDFDRAANPLRLEGLNLGNQRASQQIAQDREMHPLRMDQVRAGTADLRQRTAQSGEEFGWRRTDREDQQSGVAAATEAIRNALTSDDAVAALERFNLTPPARAVAMATIERQWGGAFGPPAPSAGPAPAGRASGGAPAGGGASTPAAPTSPGLATAVGASRFSTIIPFAETRNYVRNVLGDAGEITGRTAEEIADQLMPHLIRRESNGRPDAVSRVGARGLAQLMPATAREVERELGMEPGETDRNPEANARAGRHYLVRMLRQYGNNPEVALAAYNAGPGRVNEWLRANPDAINQEVRAGGARAASLIQDATARVAQDQAVGIQGNYRALMSDTTTDREAVVQQLRARGASFENVPVDLVQQALDSIYNRGGLTWAAAGALLRNAGTNEAMSWFNPRRIFERNGIALNERRLDEEVRALRTDTRYEGDRTASGLLASAQAVQTAQASFEQAAAQLLEVQRRAEVVPGVAQHLPRYTERYERARQVLQETLARQEARPERRPQFDPPRGQTEGNRARSGSSSPARTGARPLSDEEAARRLLDFLSQAPA